MANRILIFDRNICLWTDRLKNNDWSIVLDHWVIVGLQLNKHTHMLHTAISGTSNNRNPQSTWSLRNHAFLDPWLVFHWTHHYIRVFVPSQRLETHYLQLAKRCLVQLEHGIPGFAVTILFWFPIQTQTLCLINDYFISEWCKFWYTLYGNQKWAVLTKLVPCSVWILIAPPPPPTPKSLKGRGVITCSLSNGKWFVISKTDQPSGMNVGMYLLQIPIWQVQDTALTESGDTSWTPLIARFMGPTLGPSGADRTQVGSMLAPWTLLSRTINIWHVWYSELPKDQGEESEYIGPPSYFAAI